MKLILVFLVILNLYADDILTQYRLNGLNSIEKMMDQKLGNPSYWENFLKNKDTTFGYSEIYSNILVCNKKKSTLKLYKKSSDDVIEVKDFLAFTGKEDGQKEKEGDLTTPIGIYRLTNKLDKVDQFYGPMAFVTSYPNTFDKYEGRDGHGIWIHGLPLNKENRQSSTKGCIVVNNKNLTWLNNEIDISKTLLIIDDKDIKKNVSKKTLADILAQLYKWRYNWLYSNFDAYITFYDKKFKRFDGMNLERFKAFKSVIFARKEKKEIKFTNISVVKYPNKKNMYQITFHEFYKTKRYKFIGNKTLIVRFTNNNMRIITEK